MDHQTIRKTRRSARPHFTAPAALAAALLLALLPCVRAAAERVGLAPVKPGGPALTRVRPIELTLSPVRPAAVKRVPAGVTAPLYTSLQLGPKERPSRFTVLVDAPDGKPSRIFVDSNGNGDLTDDPAPEWTYTTYAGRDNQPLLRSTGGATVQVPYGKRVVPTHVILSRNDTSDPERAPQFLPVYCTEDYAREGAAMLGGARRRVWLVDALTRGDFRGSGVNGQAGIFLLIDVNGNGKIDARGETYDATQPFNIGGTTYEARGLDAEGLSLEIVPSTRQVAEILPPPDLSVGKPVVAFRATATNGQSIQFPGDYKRKLVLLYFWATWCGDCSRELPYVIRAYQAYHRQGLEVLGISLDHADQSVQLASFTKARGMEWPEVYDGKTWDAEIASLYYVRETPTGLLVDGDTGKIIANGSDLLADKLGETIKRALQSR
jgi:peroxiredoxin